VNGTRKGQVSDDFVVPRLGCSLDSNSFLLNGAVAKRWWLVQ